MSVLEGMRGYARRFERDVETISIARAAPLEELVFQLWLDPKMAVASQFLILLFALCLGVGSLPAQGPPKPAGPASPANAARFEVPDISKSIFTNDLGMMQLERGQLATHVSGYVCNQLGEAIVAGDAPAIALGEKLIALALHLDVRNRRAVTARYQLGRGVAPNRMEQDFESAVFSELLLKRSEALLGSGKVEDHKLARYLVAVAVELNPRNDDAVYRQEMLARSHGEVPWGRLTQPAPEPKSAAAPSVRRAETNQ